MNHPFICLFVATQLIIHSSSPPAQAQVEADAGTEQPYSIILKGVTDQVTNPSVLLSQELIAAEKVIVRFSKSFNGLAAMLTPQEAAKVAAGAASLFPSRKLTLHTTRTWSLLGLSSQSPRNLESEGDIIVGVMDTGVWPESESYNDNLLNPIPAKWQGSCKGGNNFNTSNCNRKLIGAQYYDKGILAGNGNQSLDDYGSARDVDGHGTHTSSTAAGSAIRGTNLYGLAAGESQGGVPGARIAAYKLCWEGGCSDTDVLSAFDDAIYDGVDVLSISFGGSTLDTSNLFQDSIAIGSFYAMKKGILVACSVGNDGPDLGKATNVAPWVITVAASNIDRQFYSTVVLGNKLMLKGRAINTRVPEGYHLLVYGADAGLNNLSINCSAGSLDPTKVKGKIVVCECGKNHEQSTTISSAGGIGMVIIDDSTTEIRAFSFGVPTSIIGMEDGETIKKYIHSSSSPTAKILPTSVPTGEPAPLLAPFSSRGPNVMAYPILKPDVTAPGINILASWSPAHSMTGEPQDDRFVNYNIVSGTSVACPHVAGTAAYVKSFHPSWSPATIKSAIMTTAKPLDARHALNMDGEFGYGSGHIDPLRAVHPGLVYDISWQDYAEFVCDHGYIESKVMRLIVADENICTNNKTGRLKDLNYPSISMPLEPGSDEPSDRWWEFTRTVTNVGAARSVYTAEVEVPLGMKVEVIPPTLSFSKLEEKKTFVIRVQAPGLKTSISPSIGNRLSAYLVWNDGVFLVRSPIVAWVAPNPSQGHLPKSKGCIPK